MRRSLFGTLLLSAAATLGLGASQERAAAPAAAPSGTGRIAGSIVGAESGRPVRFAKVTLSTGAGEVSVVTDDAGGFSFERLGAGTYTLQVSKPGYLETAYGQVRPGTDTPGRPIRLGERERIERLVVPLSHGGSIAGVVRDDRGEPAFQARVTVSRWVMRNGVRTLQSVDQTETDERGGYRISLLPPRPYVVSAQPAEEAIPESSGDPHPYGFAPVFYPSETSAQAALAIPLALGEERSNVDLQLPLGPLGRVTGIVVDTGGRPVASVSVSLAGPGSFGLDPEPATETDASGRFGFDRVVPGTYVARAGQAAGVHEVKFSLRKVMLEHAGSWSVELNGTPDVLKAKHFSIDVAKEPDDAAGSAPRGSTSADVTVNGGAATDLVLTLEPPRAVSGRVMFEGQSARPSLGGMQVVLNGFAPTGGDHMVKLADDGTFTVPNVTPGRYTLDVPGAAPPWNLASAVWAGTDVLDFLLDVPRDRDVREVTVTFRDRESELAGTVTDQAGQPIGDRMVVAFAADQRLWAAGSQRIQAAPIADGRFSFTHLRPGAYRLAVVEGAEPDEWLDPQFLRRVVTASVLITLGDGERKVQDLRVR